MGPLPVTVTTVFRELTTVVYYTTHVPAWALLILVVLGLLGLSEWVPRGRRRADLGRERQVFTLVLLVWFAIPFTLGVLAALAIKPALMQTRYWMPLAPPLAILTAMGLIRLAELALGAVVGWRRTPRSGGRVGAGILSFVLAASLLVPTMWADNLSARSLGGHGRNPTGVLKVVQQTRDEVPRDPRRPFSPIRSTPVSPR